MNIFNLLISFVKGQSSIESFSTLAVDFVIKTFQLSDGSVVNCFIFDTCGQERYIIFSGISALKIFNPLPQPNSIYNFLEQYKLIQ